MSTTDPEFTRAAESVGLPPRIFLYTLEQVAYCVGLTEVELRRKYVHFDQRGARAVPLRGMILARNVAPPDKRPVWRIAEGELVRWLKFKGFKFVESYQMLK